MILPKFNYLFRNCPVWIPASFFREIDRIVGSFIWSGRNPRLARTTLFLPADLGGLALPNFQLYFWAAMLVTVHWWFRGSRSNVATCLEANILGSLTDLRNFPYRGPKAYCGIPGPTRATWRVWEAARRRYLRPGQLSPAHPLWGNPRLKHFRMIPDPQVWARYGVTLLEHVMSGGQLLSLHELTAKFGLPRWMGFRYLQLGHAARAQFPQTPLLQTDPIEDLLSPGDLSKPLSSLYNALLGRDSPKINELWEKWRADIPSLDREGWEDCLEYGPKLVIASKDKLIQVKFIHRVYYTPQRLHRIFPERDPPTFCLLV